MAKTFSKDLWTPRSVAETRDIYEEWAPGYDEDVLGAGYATPDRIAATLKDSGLNPAAPILDYGCGTGLSGVALNAAGFGAIDGTDISAEMLARADETGVYRKLWLGDIDAAPSVAPGDYAAITATGVISLGAAPPETLALVLTLLAPGGLLALSYNEATLDDQRYLDAMTAATQGPATLLSETYGPHLPKKNMHATVYLLEKN